MKAPVTIWLVVLFLGLYGIYGFWIAIAAKSWPTAVPGLLAFAACGSLAAGTRLSQYIVYLLAFLLAAGWAFAGWLAASGGWPYPDIPSTVISLLPGTALVLGFGAACLVVYRHFQE
jgi:hypothetical protein